MAVQITITDLTTKVDQGWKKKALAEHYGLPEAQMTKVLKEAGLQIRKFHAPKFELIDDTHNNQGDLTDEILAMEASAMEEMDDAEAEHDFDAAMDVAENIPQEATTAGSW